MSKIFYTLIIFILLGFLFQTAAKPYSKHSRWNRSFHHYSKSSSSHTQESEKPKETPVLSVQNEETQPQITSSVQPPVEVLKDDTIPFMHKDQPQIGASESEPPNGTKLFFRAAGALLIILGLLVATVWGAKHLRKGRFSLTNENEQLTLLKSLPIGEKRFLTIVEFRGQVLLLGSTPQSITLLASDENEKLAPIDTPSFKARCVSDLLDAGDSEAFNRELNHFLKR